MAIETIKEMASAAHTYPGLDPTDLQSERSYNSMKAYSLSKLANILFTYELARRLAGTGVTANCLHPGFVGTDIFGAPSPKAVSRLVWRLVSLFALTPQRGAETSVFLASDPSVEGVTGQYFVKQRPHRSSRLTYDVDLARRLWDLSAGLTGLD
jgi:NAD(P)-dependent dehydrogenase (short-subunit alcohol dehydrogenase family)